MAAYNYGYPGNPYILPQRPMDNTYAYNNPVIKGRPVSSFEEARASMIDFDGSVFYFPDLANQRIYTKQINLDGTPSIKIYELAAAPPQAAPQQVDTSDLVTKEEFNKTIEGLTQQIAALSQVSAATSPQPAQEQFKF